jgi:catechol O-methyltransferase
VERDRESFRTAQQIVEFAGLDERITLLCGESAELIPTLDGPFDLVFLDHWKNVYERDVRALERHQLLRDGTVILADNVGPIFDVDAYLGYVRGRFPSRYIAAHLEYTTIPDGMELTTYRGSRNEE